MPVQPAPPDHPALDDRHHLAGVTLAGRISVERAVARGGFGLVYRAFHLHHRVPVALKVLNVPEQYSDAVKVEFHRRFAQEAQIVYALEHPAIARLLDHGFSSAPTGEQVPWMALEWLDGRTLGAMLRSRPGASPIAPADAVALLRPVIEALAMAHARGVAHRDVTPANVFLCESHRGVTARLIDFGVARVMEPDAEPGSGFTTTGSTISAFSRPYAAPEQFGQTRTGPWTDVHALALLLTQLMTLRAPYEGGNGAEILAAAMSERRPTPGSKGVDVGPFEPVLQRALALRPADRYANATSLLAALSEAAAASEAPGGVTTTPELVRGSGADSHPPAFAIRTQLPAAPRPVAPPSTPEEPTPWPSSAERSAVDDATPDGRQARWRSVSDDDAAMRRKLILIAAVPIVFGLALLFLRYSPLPGARREAYNEGLYDSGYRNHLPSAPAKNEPVAGIDPSILSGGASSDTDAGRPDAAASDVPAASTSIGSQRPPGPLVQPSRTDAGRGLLTEDAAAAPDR